MDFGLIAHGSLVENDLESDSRALSEAAAYAVQRATRECVSQWKVRMLDRIDRGGAFLVVIT